MRELAIHSLVSVVGEDKSGVVKVSKGRSFWVWCLVSRVEIQVRVNWW